jgi:hypothetical protein
LNFIQKSRLAALLCAVAVTAACASAPTNGGPSLGLEERVAAPTFDFMTDTFSFPNLIRARHPADYPDLYANYCFVLARGIRQFIQFARFDPTLPKLDREGYVERVKRIAAIMPWEPPLAPDDRVVIPGYTNLREFSREQEAAVKEGLGGRLLTLFHWTNWRVMLKVSRDNQEAVAHKIIDELRQGNVVQLLVTNWPKPELNHTVVAYESRPTDSGVEFLIWDPNNPVGPGIMTFDQYARTFWATDMFDTEQGPIRAFRMYYSPLL